MDQSLKLTKLIRSMIWIIYNVGPP